MSAKQRGGLVTCTQGIAPVKKVFLSPLAKLTPVWRSPSSECAEPGMNDLREAVLASDVWDTHTHLVGAQLPAPDFWEIGHYFWLLRELKAAGYPAEHDLLPPGERAEAYADALEASRNTAMNQAMRATMQDLYGIVLTDAASILEADEAVRAGAQQPGWAAQVLDRAGIRRSVVNVESDADFGDLRDHCRLLPRIESRIAGWTEALTGADDPDAAADEVVESIDSFARDLKAQDLCGMMASLGEWCERTAAEPSPPSPPVDAPQAKTFVLHQIAAAASRHDLFLQLFLGMEKQQWGSQVVANNRTDRILALHGLFERYECSFDLVLACNLLNFDAVQTARVFPNVYLGGLWWFNFRPSSYRDAMQYRLEALPPSKAALIASDARFVEWSHAKVMMVKRLLAQFLSEQVERGWMGSDDALWVAREWLHDAAMRLYGEAKGD